MDDHSLLEVVRHEIHDLRRILYEMEDHPLEVPLVEVYLLNDFLVVPLEDHDCHALVLLEEDVLLNVFLVGDCLLEDLLTL